MLRLHPDAAFPSAHRICAAKSLHIPQYVDHAIERPSRDSPCGVTAVRAHHRLASADVLIFAA